MTDFDKFVNQMPENIYAIFLNEKEIDIRGSIIGIEKLVSKYSSTKIPIYKITVDGKPIHTKSKISYKCVFCDKDCKRYSVKSLLRRINQLKLDCTNCKELYEDKQTLQSQRLMGNKCALGLGKKFKTQKKKQSDLSNKELIQKSNSQFNSETNEFKKSYFDTNFTQNEFDLIKSKIITVNGVNLDGLIYCQNIIINNQVKYYPRLYDESKDKFIKFNYIRYRCENCETFFTNRDAYIQKNRRKIFCKDCRFTNDTFKIRKCKNKNGKIVLYRSKFEKELIDFCNDNQIEIVSCPKVEYFWNKKKRRYHVDFQINDLLVETKGRHIWHKNNLKSGKWQAKEKAAKKYVKSSGTFTNFMVVYPDTFEKFKESLLDKI